MAGYTEVLRSCHSYDRRIQPRALIVILQRFDRWPSSSPLSNMSDLEEQMTDSTASQKPVGADRDAKSAEALVQQPNEEKQG